ncbi:MAG TPA: SCO family protein [Longimicrobiales bacterium]|nr:SCO family protein [Longimicrobiales bacterium]
MRIIAFVSAAIVALVASALVVQREADKGGSELPVYWDAPAFELVNQEGDTVRNGDLAGRVWIASFIFTNCTDICPVISARLAQVRNALAADGRLGDDVRLVSISVDPARDTPAVLLDYSKRFGGSPPAEWAFLTGSPPEAVRALIQEGFKVTALDPMMDHGMPYQIDHSPRILVIDREGRVRGAHDVNEGDIVERLLSDARELAG